MLISPQHIDFLKSIKILSKNSQSVFIKGKLESLVHPFWTFTEIKNNLSLRQDWEVDANLIPFYGDWHDLICINQLTGVVVMLDDDRNIIASWQDSASFVSDLSDEEVADETLADASVMSVWLSPEFADKFIKKK